MTTTSKTTGDSKTPEWERYKKWCAKHRDYLKKEGFWREGATDEEITEHMIFVYTRNWSGRTPDLIKELVLAKARQEQE